MLKNKFRRLLNKGQRGQSLVEFSLTAIIILLILSGLLDLGRLYFIYVALEDSAGEAALYLSLYPQCPDATAGTDCTDPNNAEWRARNAAGGVLNWSTTTITLDPGLAAAGQTVSATIVYPYRILTPLISQIANEINLTVVATNTILNDPAP